MSFKVNLHTSPLLNQKNTQEALEDECQVQAMQEELNQFKRNNVWKLVLASKGKTFVRTKWVHRIKFDENVKQVKNKLRLVDQGFNQEEGFYNRFIVPMITCYISPNSSFLFGAVFLGGRKGKKVARPLW